MSEALPKLAVIGGTGDLGGGLARRWAKAGYTVINTDTAPVEEIVERIVGELAGEN